eukprot:7006547-Ditylum_brightwellii.AAC.1
MPSKARYITLGTSVAWGSGFHSEEEQLNGAWPCILNGRSIGSVAIHSSGESVLFHRQIVGA